MTDFHTHILPGIDDGSPSIEITREMLETEKAQRVDRIVATPHFYATRDSFDRFLAKRGAALAEVQRELYAGNCGVPGATRLSAENKPATTGAEQMPELMVGAEVYFFPGMGKAARLPELCITGNGGRTDVILIEMPFQQWTEEVLQELRDVLGRQHLRVVLAHVERYVEFQKDTEIWERVMTLPLTIQLNAGSFLKGWRRRRLSLRLLEQHGHVILGSDCHNLASRPPNLGEARAVIEKKSGPGQLDRIDREMEALLG